MPGGPAEGVGGVPGGDRGSALIGALLAMLLLSLLAGAAVLRLESAERARGASREIRRLDAAGQGVIEVMTARLRSRAGLRLGAIDAADVEALNAGVGTLPATEGAMIDPAETGFRIVGVREQEPVPDDTEPLDVWTDQPRIRYARLPRPQGQTASRIIEVEMRVRVTGPLGGRRTLTRTAAVSRVSPYPYALYWSGAAAELCALGSGGATVAGAVRVDGTASFPACTAPVTLIGTLDARDGVRSDDPRARILHEEGALPIPSWSREAAETSATAVLAGSLGRVRVPPAQGGTYEDRRAQDAELAGTGECADRTGACGGNGYFAPGVTVQRTAGPPTGSDVTCGRAYGFGAACRAAVVAALRYHPWPWTGPVPAGAALPDPARPGRLWKGLLFDPRREARCTAQVAGNTFQTHRCPSNTFGWLLELSALPPVAGGVLHVRASAADPPGRAASGAQEALVIRGADRVAAPLAIVSDLPVFVVGSLNTVPRAAWRGPPPLMIDAPRITLLPAEADAQLGLGTGSAGWASVWDVAAPAGTATPSALPLSAAGGVTLYAVLRTRVCGRPGGVYQGGALDQAPAVLGDWAAAEVRVVGAVEQREDTELSPAACAWWGSGHGAAADGSAWRAPDRRTILYDPRLAHPAFVVPGSFLPANLPPAGVPGAARRDAVRQGRATGGYGILRITRATARREPRPAIPLPAPPPLPPAPPALPQ